VATGANLQIDGKSDNHPLNLLLVNAKTKEKVHIVHHCVLYMINYGILRTLNIKTTSRLCFVLLLPSIKMI
jgi:hypothetical protein